MAGLGTVARGRQLKWCRATERIRWRRGGSSRGLPVLVDGDRVSAMGDRTPGDAVRILRQFRGLSQRQLAHESGVVQPSISAIESGRESLGGMRAKRIALALGVHPSDLLYPERNESWPTKRKAGREASRAVSNSSRKLMMRSGVGQHPPSGSKQLSSSPGKLGRTGILVTSPSNLVDVLREFEGAGVRYLVIGGYAVGAHSKPRTTKDLDLWLDSSCANIERACVALRRYGAPAFVIENLRKAGVTDVVWFGRIPERVDLLQSIRGVAGFASAWGHRKRYSIGGVTSNVIGRDDLLANKRIANRPQDRIDVRMIERALRK
jgi:transcriptional regulator with XRE-family HTH domain